MRIEVLPSFISRGIKWGKAEGSRSSNEQIDVEFNLLENRYAKLLY